MTHTEGASPQPEPARRWRVENRELISPDGQKFITSEAILGALNETESLRAELGLHKLNEKGQCPMCYDAGYEDGEEALRKRVRLADKVLRKAEFWLGCIPETKDDRLENARALITGYLDGRGETDGVRNE